MDIELLPHQREFITSQESNPCICGGLGSGKTFAATMRLLVAMLQEPGINTLLGMPTYDLLKMRAMPGFKEELEQLGIAYSEHKSDYAIDIHGFGTVYFRSYDRPERWVAFAVAHTILDELDTLPKDKAQIVWRKANERTRQTTKSGRNTIGNVTTPDHGVNGFTYQKWVKEKQDGYQIIYASTIDNHFLPEGYVDQIRKNYDPLLADAFLHGRFVSFSADKVYHFFDRKTHHTNREISPGDIVHVGLDFNIGGCCAVAFVIDNNQPVAVDEFTSHDTRDVVNNMHSRYKNHRVVVYPDASGAASSTNASQSDIAIIEQAGFTVRAKSKNPAVRDRINACNALLSRGELTVNTDKCKELTFALESQGYTAKGEPEKFNEHPAVDDWVDAFGYCISYLYPVEKPITQMQFKFTL